MINFKEIDGKLCMMLEEPIPYMGFTKPVVIGLKHDYCEHKFIADDEFTNIDTLCQNFKIMFYNMFHVYGYPVEEGSAEWALYQMQQGKKVSHRKAIGDAYWALNENKNVQYYDMANLSYIGIIREQDEFLTYFEKHMPTGWQLYEPKSNPCPTCNGTGVEQHQKHLLSNAKTGDKVRLRNGEVYVLKIQKDELQHGFDYLVCSLTHDVYGYCQTSNEESPFDIIELIPEPQFKVGDWVELGLYHNHHGQIKEMFCIGEHKIDGIEFYRSRPTFTITGLSGEFYYSAISRKLKPSEVVIQIGCLRGNVKRWDSTTFHMFHGNSKFSKIHLDALDHETRQLVQSLLKAQEEK